MPLYEFKCPLCGATIEKLQKYDDPPPLCSNGLVPMERQISAGAFELKGTGWYKTDFKGK